MEIRIDKATFLRSLSVGQAIAERKSSTMAILSNVLLRTEGRDRLVLGATDLNVFAVGEMPAAVIAEGAVTLGARHLFEIVKNLPASEVLLKRGENQFCELRSGKSFYRIMGLPARDYPRLPAYQEVTFAPVDAKVFARLIGWTSYAVSGDEARYNLSGALLECGEGRVRLVATDGHRLALAEAPLPGAPELGRDLLVPRKALAEFKRLFDAAPGNCELGLQVEKNSDGTVKSRTLYVKSAGSEGVDAKTVVSAKLIEATFPAYDQVVPRDNDKIVVVERPTLIGALRRMAVMASDKTAGTRLMGEGGGLRVSCENIELGEAEEEVPVESYNGPSFRMGFNSRYLLEALEMVEGEKVRVELSGELDPGLIRPLDSDSPLAVIMPMRI